MNLNDLLRREGIDPEHTLVLRHRPHEPMLRTRLPWLAAEQHEVFNAYQQTHGKDVERAMNGMVGTGFVASLIGHEAGKAIFVGLYAIRSSKPLTYNDYWSIPEYAEMKEKYGVQGWSQERDDRNIRLWFDLQRTDFYESWQGKLIVGWPGGERSWWRRAHRNEGIPVVAVLEESALTGKMPDWKEVELRWHDLAMLPASWKSKLSEWRGVYFIFDESDGKGYVGSAYGRTNILGRWQQYASRGHGGNVLLRERNPGKFIFTILERVSPDMDAAEVIRLEALWKQRLHTRLRTASTTTSRK